MALLIGSCSPSTTVTERHGYDGKALPKPTNIYVQSFAATPADVPSNSKLASDAAEQTETLSPDKLATARKLGAEVAKALAENLKSMGLPASHVDEAPDLENDDIVMRGYFVSVDEGSAVERVTIGFGAGAANLKTVVEAFQQTATGLQQLGGGEVDAGGAKTPGEILPVAVVAAKANPIGLLVNSGVQAYQESTGTSTIEGAGKRTADEIFEQIKPTIEKQGWV